MASLIHTYSSIPLPYLFHTSSIPLPYLFHTSSIPLLYLDLLYLFLHTSSIPLEVRVNKRGLPEGSLCRPCDISRRDPVRCRDM